MQLEGHIRDMCQVCNLATEDVQNLPFSQKSPQLIYHMLLGA